MPTVLLDWGERIVELEASKHRLDEIFEAMTTTDIVLRVVLWPTDVLFVQIDRFDGFLCGDTSAHPGSLFRFSRCVILGVLLRCRSPLLLLSIVVRL